MSRMAGRMLTRFEPRPHARVLPSPERRRPATPTSVCSPLREGADAESGEGRQRSDRPAISQDTHDRGESRRRDPTPVGMPPARTHDRIKATYQTERKLGSLRLPGARVCSRLNPRLLHAKNFGLESLVCATYGSAHEAPVARPLCGSSGGLLPAHSAAALLRGCYAARLLA
jgi:hypothetical protein